nr:MFS transporter [Maliibacterium massiliense]
MLPKGKRLPLFLALVGMYWFSFYTYSPIFTEYVRGLSTSQMAGTIIASYGFVQMLLRIPVGMLSDKLKTRKYFVTMGLVITGIGALGMALVPVPGWLLFFRGMTGAGVATWVPFSILFSSYFERGHATRAIGIVNAFNFGGQMVATLIGGYLAQWTGSPLSTFYLAAATAGVAAVLSLFLVDQKKEDFPARPVRLRELAAVAKDRTLMIASTLAILTQLASFATVYGFTPTFAKANALASSAQLGIMTTLVTLPAIFASPLAAWFAKKMRGAHNAMLLAFVLSAAYCVAVPHIHDIYVFYIAQFFFGAARGLSTSILMAQAIADIAPAQRGTAMGFFQAIYGVGMTLGPQLVGIFGGQDAGGANLVGLAVGFYVVAGIQLAGAVMAMTLLRKKRGGARA